MKRQPWHDSLLESLAVLADLPLQSRIWLDGDDTVFLESPAELVCQVFDDSAVDELLKTGRLFSDDIDTMLRMMSSLAGRLDVERPPTELLNDPDWIRLSRLAQSARADIEQILPPS